MSDKSLLKNLKAAWQTKAQTGSKLSVVSSLTSNDAWILVFLGAVSLFVPALWSLVFLYVAMNTTVRSIKRELKEVPGNLEQILLFIQMNHLQSLTEAIELDPHILYLDYKKHSLLYWCNHYNNTKAQMVIVQLIKKYPKENESLAA